MRIRELLEYPPRPSFRSDEPRPHPRDMVRLLPDVVPDVDDLQYHTLIQEFCGMLGGEPSAYRLHYVRDNECHRRILCLFRVNLDVPFGGIYHHGHARPLLDPPLRLSALADEGADPLLGD